MSNIVTLGKQAITHTDILMRVKALIESRAVTGAQLGREIGVSPPAISQVLGDSYKADPAAIIEKIASWLELREARQARPVNPGFVMTHTARQIMDDMTYAHVTQSIAVIYGASGVGKSEALRHYASHNPNVWMVTASPCRSTLTECLYELAMELGMEQAPRLRGPLARAVRRRLVGTEGLIVIDEADHLDYPTLEELRILQEEVGIGLVLVGNNKIYTQLTGGRRNEDFARLFSRIAKRRGIHKTKQNDVKAIADAWAITGQGERDLLQQISERPGGLRLLTKALKLAALYAKDEAINVQFLKAAFTELEGIE